MARVGQRAALPRRCVLCRRVAGPLCATCASGLEPPPSLDPPAGVGVIGAVVAYRGPGAALVTRWKFGNERGLSGRFAAALAAASPAGPHDAVTWAPTGRDRRRRRRFDQAELLARAVARHLGCPCRRLLVRVEGPPQAGRSAAARAEATAFRAVGRPPARVLVVDDVCTTGATLAAAAGALRGAGATSVDAVVLARTPAPS